MVGEARRPRGGEVNTHFDGEKGPAFRRKGRPVGYLGRPLPELLAASDPPAPPPPPLALQVPSLWQVSPVAHRVESGVTPSVSKQFA